MFWALLTCDCYYSVDALIFTHFLMTYMRSEFTYDSRMTLIKLNWFRYLVITNLFLISLGLVINIFLISENVCLPLINDWSDGVLMKKVAAGASTDMASCNSDVDKHLTNGQNQYSSHSLPQRFTSKFTLRSCLHKHVTPYKRNLSNKRHLIFVIRTFSNYLQFRLLNLQRCILENCNSAQSSD